MANDERLRELEERYEGYTVYDNTGSRIGKVDDLFVDETDREEYIGVKMGLFGLSGTTMIPMELARVNEQERTIVVQDTKDHVKDAPNYTDEDDITLEYENEVRRHFGLEDIGATPELGTYGPYTGATAGGGAAAGATGAGPGIDREPGGIDREPGGIGREPGGIDREPGGIGREPGGVDREPGGIGREPGGIGREPGMERGGETPMRSSAEGAQEEESMGTRVRRRLRGMVE